MRTSDPYRRARKQSRERPTQNARCKWTLLGFIVTVILLCTVIFVCLWHFEIGPWEKTEEELILSIKKNLKKLEDQKFFSKLERNTLKRNMQGDTKHILKKKRQQYKYLVKESSDWRKDTKGKSDQQRQMLKNELIKKAEQKFPISGKNWFKF